MGWTKDQEKAIYHDGHSIVVSAAAGSGKTAVLVERIIKKLTREDNPVRPDSLLVVTFTNAAAAEMRAKILKETDKLRKTNRLNPSAVREMQICTIDSFIMGLVREHCAEAGLEADFEMADDISLEKLADAAAEEVINEAESSPLPGTGRMFDLLSMNKGDNSLKNLLKMLESYSSSFENPEQWFSSVAGAFDTDSDAFAVEKQTRIIREYARGAVCESLELNSRAMRIIMSIPEPDVENYSGIIDCLNSDRQLFNEIARILDEGSWDETVSVIKTVSFSAFTSPRGKKNTHPEQKDHVKMLRDKSKANIAGLIETVCISSQENLDDCEYLLPAVEEIVRLTKNYAQKFGEKKKELNAWSFNDLLHIALKLLTDESEPDRKSRLAKEISGSLTEILIDEYQDTNRAQDSLFMRLSNNGENVFVVGDKKQSIYGFRLADPECFSAKTNRALDESNTDELITLSENFRSRYGVLSGVNFIFRRLMTEKTGGENYSGRNMLKFGAAENYCGYSSPVCPDMNIVIPEYPDFQKEEAEARFIAFDIRRRLDAGEEVSMKTGERRKALPGDYCILLAKVNKYLPLYIKAFDEYGLRLSVADTDGFFNKREIVMMMSFLRVLSSPRDSVSLMATLMSPLFGFSSDELAKLKINYGRKTRGSFNLYSALCAAAEAGDEKCRIVRETVSRFTTLAATLPVSELIERICEETAFPAVICAMLKTDSALTNLRLLSEIAASRYTGAPMTLLTLINYADTCIDTNKNPSFKTSAASSQDRVKLMTIHKSKGLQFNFVYVAGMNSKFNDSDVNASISADSEMGLGIKIKKPSSLQYYDTVSHIASKILLRQKSRSEEIRLYYVAFTRAKEKLTLVFSPETDIRKYSIFESESEMIPERTVITAQTPADFIVPALLKHRDSALLLGHASYNLPSIEKPEDNEPSDPEKQICDIGFFRYTPPENETGKGSSNTREYSAEEKARLLSKITDACSFDYPYLTVSAAPSKRTASNLHGNEFHREFFASSVPAFASGSKLTGADKGTATHKFMEFADFERCENGFTGEEITRLVSEGRLTEAEGRAINTPAVESFFRSDIYSELASADRCFREQNFTVALGIEEVDSSVSKEDAAGEKTVLIGKIDLLYINDGKAVIVDYKTDRIKDVSELPPKYRGQMEMYVAAVRKALGIEVSKVVLYSLELGEATEL